MTDRFTLVLGVLVVNSSSGSNIAVDECITIAGSGSMVFNLNNTNAAETSSIALLTYNSSCPPVNASSLVLNGLPGSCDRNVGTLRSLPGRVDIVFSPPTDCSVQEATSSLTPGLIAVIAIACIVPVVVLVLVFAVSPLKRRLFPYAQSRRTQEVTLEPI